jgi:hypothetical protein
MSPDAILYGYDKFVFKKLIVCAKEDLHENELMFTNAYKMIMGDNMYNDLARHQNTSCFWTRTTNRILDSEWIQGELSLKQIHRKKLIAVRKQLKGES